MVDKMTNMKIRIRKHGQKKRLIHYLTVFSHQSHECIWNVTSGDSKDQNRKSLSLEEFDMPVQECNINRYDYKKSGIISEANSYYFRKSAPPQTFNLVLDTPQTYRPEPIQNQVE